MTIKTSLCLALLCLTLAACTKPKNVLIPPDPKRWASLTDDIQKLDLDDRALVTSYLIRMGATNALTNEVSTVPPGTTIGQAIEMERDYEEQAKLHAAQIDAIKARQDAIKAKALAAQKSAVARMQAAITFMPLAVTILPKKIDAARYSPQLSVPFSLKNDTAKEISGVKGTIVIQDLFGAPLQNLEISADRTIAPGQEVTLTNYVWELNEFDDVDKHLLTMDLSKVKASFKPSMIVYADGSKDAAPDVPDYPPPEAP